MSITEGNKVVINGKQLDDDKCYDGSLISLYKNADGSCKNQVGGDKNTGVGISHDNVTAKNPAADAAAKAMDRAGADMDKAGAAADQAGAKMDKSNDHMDDVEAGIKNGTVHVDGKKIIDTKPGDVVNMNDGTYGKITSNAHGAKVNID